MSKATSDTRKEYKYTRKCLLHEIKKCNTIIHTNRINQKFCCDSHRYTWHNNMKALFKRVSKLEERVDKIETEETMRQIVSRDVENAPRLEENK